MFYKVQQLKLCDRASFERRLFEVVSHSFPFLQFLHVTNTEPMKDKECTFISITFPYLTFLDLKCAHVDYVEEFLLQKRTHLPTLLNLSMKYQLLAKITNNFTNDATQYNFKTIKSLDVDQVFIRPESVEQYFPLLWIVSINRASLERSNGFHFIAFSFFFLYWSPTNKTVSEIVFAPLTGTIWKEEKTFGSVERNSINIDCVI